jgi:hypothetical protein
MFDSAASLSKSSPHPLQKYLSEAILTDSQTRISLPSKIYKYVAMNKSFD